MKAEEILKNVKSGDISIEEALVFFKKHTFEEMEYAKPDIQRELRTGFAEVIFCQGKPDEYLVSIFKKMIEETGEVFGTRASGHQYELVKKENGINFSKPLSLAYTGHSRAVLDKYLEDSKSIYEEFTSAGGVIPTSTVGCTIGTHIGPGAIALAFFAP